MWKWLKTAATFGGKAALQVAEARYPFVAELVGMVSEQIDQAEQRKDLGGAQKKEQVMGQLDVRGEVIQDLLLRAGYAVANRDQFLACVDDLVEVVHGMKKTLTPTGANGVIPAGASITVEAGRVVSWEK